MLVVALGADLDPAATAGLVEGGHEFYTEEGAFATRRVLDEFDGGRIVVGVCGTPFKCPPAPSETALLVQTPRSDPSAALQQVVWNEHIGGVALLGKGSASIGGVADRHLAVAPGGALTLDGAPFSQESQKYHAKSYGALRARYAAVSDRTALDQILEETGCRRWLG